MVGSNISPSWQEAKKKQMQRDAKSTRVQVDEAFALIVAVKDANKLPILQAPQRVSLCSFL